MLGTQNVSPARKKGLVSPSQRMVEFVAAALKVVDEGGLVVDRQFSSSPVFVAPPTGTVGRISPSYGAPELRPPVEYPQTLLHIVPDNDHNLTHPFL